MGVIVLEKLQSGCVRANANLDVAHWCSYHVMSPFEPQALCNFLASLRIANGFRPSSFLLIIPGAYPSDFIYEHLHHQLEIQIDSPQRPLNFRFL